MPNNFLSNGELRKILKQATEEERLSLTKIVNENENETIALPSKKLQEEICLAGGHSVANFFRGYQGTGYLDILDDVINELKIPGLLPYDKIKYFDEIDSLQYSKKKSIKKGIKYAEEAEEDIILELLELAYEKMSTEQKLDFDKQINNVVQEQSSSTSKSILAGSAGLMALGELGGFATYTFLTSAMSTISMGTLGFGSYTAATSLLSTVLGPVGWTALGGYAIYSLGSPNINKMMLIVATVGEIRQRVKYENSIMEY